MVPGHLAVHKGSYSIVLSYYDEEKKRHYKRIGTGLAANEKNKSKAEEMLLKARMNFFIPQCIDDFKSDMLFIDYLHTWLQVVKIRVKPTTFHGYECIVKTKIIPFFKNSRLGVDLL